VVNSRFSHNDHINEAAAFEFWLQKYRLANKFEDPIRFGPYFALT